jgi:hypothetical protein
VQVLAALQLLVNVLGPDSPAAYPLLLPLLQHSLDVNSNRWDVARCGALQ